MQNTQLKLRYDPAKALRSSGSIAVRYLFEKDIVGQTAIQLEDVWQSREALAIVRKQQTDGSWVYTAKKADAWAEVNYEVYETTKQLAELAEKFRLNASHPAIQRTADYLLSHQSKRGDIRGVYANQYSPNFTAMVLELLIEAGFGKDPRVIKSLDWLIGDRQQDGGWALAFRTKSYDLRSFGLNETIEADYSKPSSAMVTGVVLRALSAHPEYRYRPETKHAAAILADSFFSRDTYPDRQSKEYWTRFGFPFYYTDIVSSLDSLSKIGGFAGHAKVIEALDWLRDKQTKDGLFDIRTTRGNRAAQKEWMTLAICRVFM